MVNDFKFVIYKSRHPIPAYTKRSGERTMYINLLYPWKKKWYGWFPWLTEVESVIHIINHEGMHQILDLLGESWASECLDGADGTMFGALFCISHNPEEYNGEYIMKYWGK